MYNTESVRQTRDQMGSPNGGVQGLKQARPVLVTMDCLEMPNTHFGRSSMNIQVIAASGAWLSV